MACTHCSGPVTQRAINLCWTDKNTLDHWGLCCDCFDLKVGQPLVQANRERTSKGLPPLPLWPDRDPDTGRLMVPKIS